MSILNETFVDKIDMDTYNSILRIYSCVYLEILDGNPYLTFQTISMIRANTIADYESKPDNCYCMSNVNKLAIVSRRDITEDEAIKMYGEHIVNTEHGEYEAMRIHIILPAYEMRSGLCLPKPQKVVQLDIMPCIERNIKHDMVLYYVRVVGIIERKFDESRYFEANL